MLPKDSIKLLFQRGEKGLLEYDLDLSAQSRSQVFTADEAARAFPLYMTEFGHFYANPGYYTRRDGKMAALLFYTREGQGVLNWKGQVCSLTPGTAVVIYCDSYHAYRTGDAGEWEFFWAHLDGPGLAGYAPMLMERLTPVKVLSPGRMEEEFFRLENLDPRRGVLARAETSQCLGAMLLEMLASLGAEEPGDMPGRGEVNALAEYIRQHMAESIGMPEFERVANLSKYHLIRLFRQQMGVPPYHYLHQCRIQRAQELLRTTSRTVAEIGAQVGYADPVNFIRHFRDILGVTPAKYRRESIRLIP